MIRGTFYRAKRRDNLEWIEGYYAKIHHYLSDEDIHIIIPIDAELYPHCEIAGFEEIYPETLCRLLPYASYDFHRDNPKVFKNDILAVWRNRRADIEHEPYDFIALADDELHLWENGMYRWYPQDTTRVKVIGNMFDNPELLGSGAIRHFKLMCSEHPDNFHDERERIIDTYGVEDLHAGCYLCNVRSDYLCRIFNGGCPLFDHCKDIYNKELRLAP